MEGGGERERALIKIAEIESAPEVKERAIEAFAGGKMNRRRQDESPAAR